MSKVDYFTNFKITVEVLNSILELPHFNSVDNRCLSSVVECDKSKILNMVALLTRAFGVVASFSLRVPEVPS